MVLSYSYSSLYCVLMWKMFLHHDVICIWFNPACCSVLLVLGIPNDEWQDDLLLLALQHENATSSCEKQTVENCADGNNCSTYFTCSKHVHAQVLSLTK
jgi:hypothetical protein